MELLEDKIKRVLKDKIYLCEYNAAWPVMFKQEKEHLLSCLPDGIIKRIEHFGSTAVPGLSAKPVIDMLVEVSSLDEAKEKIVPILEGQGYDYFWRPTFGDDGEPFYVWFIKRGNKGQRTHHIHMVESHFDHWDRLFFRDYLIEFADVAAEYQKLKQELTSKYPKDRIKYTNGKTPFTSKVTKRAKEYFLAKRALRK